MYRGYLSVNTGTSCNQLTYQTSVCQANRSIHYKHNGSACILGSEYKYLYNTHRCPLNPDCGGFQHTRMLQICQVCTYAINIKYVTEPAGDLFNQA